LQHFGGVGQTLQCVFRPLESVNHSLDVISEQLGVGKASGHGYRLLGID
jgi:hypothetical protein